MTQADHILEHLQTHGSITGLEALDRYGCFRLAARIHDLTTKRGIPIKSEPFKTAGGATISRYSLVEEPDLFTLNGLTS